MIQKTKAKDLRDRNVRKELEAKKDKAKLVKEWGSGRVTHKDLRNRRLQWLLFQVIVTLEKGRQGELGNN